MGSGPVLSRRVRLLIIVVIYRVGYCLMEPNGSSSFSSSKSDSHRPSPPPGVVEQSSASASGPVPGAALDPKP